jgi:hypothetical protein
MILLLVPSLLLVAAGLAGLIKVNRFAELLGAAELFLWGRTLSRGSKLFLAWLMSLGNILIGAGFAAVAFSA